MKHRESSEEKEVPAIPVDCDNCPQCQINALRERIEDLENQMKAVNYLILKGR